MCWTNVKSAAGSAVDVELDQLDVDILRVLLKAGDLSHREVARQVGASPTTVGERFKGLKRAGLVQGTTLRLAPEALPGKGRLVRGRVHKEGAVRLLSGVEEVQGVVEAAVEQDGVFVAIVVARDLQEEENLLVKLEELGVEKLMSSPIKRATGPPLVHLFEEKVGMAERCAVCGTESTKPLQESVDGRRVIFCCPSCRSIYLERYAEMSRRAKQNQ